ncbi:DUF4307 domain-containing protein [Nocardioides mangrovicus]|uniref:DUF4307 domain-containing protein n=1 Tax=Nocardioides mangrovicus TaxID=2478913 RepID=UPI0013149563|nr:DUF4307 domain-containing protein [Nocardioides mangrovicus]
MEGAQVGRGADADLAARYGTHRPLRRLVLVVVTIVVAGAGLGWLAWAAWFHSNPAISAGVQGYDVRSSHRVDITVQVRLRDRFVHGECVVEATASDHAVVGERSVTVRRAGTVSVVVRTEREATAVDVAECSER